MKFIAITSIVRVCIFTILVSACSAHKDPVTKYRNPDVQSDSENVIKTETNMSGETTNDEVDAVIKKLDKYLQKNKLRKAEESICWNKLNIPKLFDIFKNYGERYGNAIEAFRKSIESSSFEKDMRKEFVDTRGAALRAIHNFDGKIKLIPAGINLMGHGMVRLHSSLLFFHRMKTMRNTQFHLMYLHNDIDNMILYTYITIPYICLNGSYERSVLGKDPSNLVYQPNYGEVNIELSNLTYKMEARYRLKKDHLNIEFIVSSLKVQSATICYELESPTNCENFKPEIFETFVRSLQSGLDLWLKDYFNDYLAFVKINVGELASQYHAYTSSKYLFLNIYMDDVILGIVTRLNDTGLNAIVFPYFSVFAPNGMILKLKGGVLRGFPTIHRRSAASSKPDGMLRTVEAMVSFAQLKLEYNYEFQSVFDSSIVKGNILFDPGDILVLLTLTLLPEPESFDMHFEPILTLRPGSLTIGGGLNRKIGSFKGLLEKFVQSMIIHNIFHVIRSLKYIVYCKPDLYIQGYHDPDDDVGGNGGKHMKVKHAEKNKRKISKQDSVAFKPPAQRNEKKAKTYNILYKEKLTLAEAGK